MLLQILSNQNVPPKEFIRFWSCQYQYANAALYDANIGKPLTPERVLELFEWKNGRPLSGMKKLSIRRNYLEAKESIPMNGTENELLSYLTGRGGAIWRIFWLHCHEPSKYPIYDQHVHRAMAKLEGWEQLEIPNHNPKFSSLAYKF